MYLYVCASTASRFRSLRLISMFPSSIRHCSPAASKGDISIESAWGHFHRVATPSTFLLPPLPQPLNSPQSCWLALFTNMQISSGNLRSFRRLGFWPGSPGFRPLAITAPARGWNGGSTRGSRLAPGQDGELLPWTQLTRTCNDKGNTLFAVTPIDPA
jgi:hypothetical protein